MYNHSSNMRRNQTSGAVANAEKRGGISAPAVPVLQRQQVIQLHPADNANSELEDQVNGKDLAVIKEFKNNSKKTSKASWLNVLRHVKADSASWRTIRDHVMHGEATNPPKGFHSTADANAALLTRVGARNPEGNNASKPYKQKARAKAGAGATKVSTFFPDNWSEDKIHAAVILRNAGVDHQVQSPFAITVNDGTAYPTTGLADPA